MHKSKVNLFNKDSIDTLDWPDHEEAQHVKSFVEPLIKEGTKTYIDNVDSEFCVLQINNHVLPVTISQFSKENSYVCSLHGQYVRYAREQMRNQNSFLNFFVKPLTHIFDKLIKWGDLDRLIVVNNWLFSTNLYPELKKTELEDIVQFLTKKYSNYTICFRCVNQFDTKELFQNLKKTGFETVFSRPIFIFDPQEKKAFKSRMIKSDLKLLKDTDYKVLKHDQIPLSAAARLKELYSSLYLDKYSKLNPQLNEKFFNLLIEKKVFELQAVEKDGVIDGIVGNYSRNGVMTSPLFGYDPQKLEDGVYRIISTILALNAKEKKMILNQSAGAASFKKLRRATKHLEYNALYVKHLNSKRKICWKVFKGIINSFGIPTMKYFDV
ncbi:MAG: hypothetical protein BGO10_06235 [Chlamydia sp. 32-24]|nr:MAG: hypothetical protein BGO10_06235 [Chlamydia sp. 32-24]